MIVLIKRDMLHLPAGINLQVCDLLTLKGSQIPVMSQARRGCPHRCPCWRMFGVFRAVAHMMKTGKPCAQDSRFQHGKFTKPIDYYARKKQLSLFNF